MNDLAKQGVAILPRVAAYTFDELIDLGADFTGYFDWLADEIETRKIDQKYIPLACTKTEFDPETKKRIGLSVFSESSILVPVFFDGTPPRYGF